MTQWKDIDTAPTDGTAILLWPYSYANIWRGRANAEVILGFYNEESDSWFNPEERTAFEPTHWMPLPEPPAEGENI